MRLKLMNKNEGEGKDEKCERKVFKEKRKQKCFSKSVRKIIVLREEMRR